MFVVLESVVRFAQALAMIQGKRGDLPRREEICSKPRNLPIVIGLMLDSRLQTV